VGRFSKVLTVWGEVFSGASEAGPKRDTSGKKEFQNQKGKVSGGGTKGGIPKEK